MKTRLFNGLSQTLSTSIKEALERLAEFADKNAKEVYVLEYPKSDLSLEGRDNHDCFMVMSPSCRIALINCSNDEGFDDYCEDVDEIISYLFQKYDYRTKLGRFKVWSSGLILKCKIDDLNDIDSFWEPLVLHTPTESKYADLLVALCTGSINDINRVGCDVPVTLLQKVKQRIQLFDADQTRFIYQEDKNNPIIIQGLSGTGKTELLLHKLKELYTDDEKNKIFVTCHNKILANSLRERIPKFFNYMKVEKQIEWQSRLWCTHAWGSGDWVHSGLYRYICHYYDIPFHTFIYARSFDVVCKEAISAIKSKVFGVPEDYPFDYILVDECQDFPASFIELCKLVARKKVYLAGDVFQSIYYENESKDYHANLFLKKCYRTSPKTLMFAQALGFGLFERKRYRWLEQKEWDACGYNYKEEDDKIILSREPINRFPDVDESYDSIIIRRYDNLYLSDEIVSVIKQIQKDNEGVTPDDICIIMLDATSDIYLAANQIERQLEMDLQVSVNKAYENKAPKAGTVLISNRNNVKGLEYPFVICVTDRLLDSYPYRNAIYTMLTRSFIQTYLLISSNCELSESIISGYEEINSHFRMSIRNASEDEVKEIRTRFSAAKMQKPLVEVASEIMKKLGIGLEKTNKLLPIVLNEGWEDLSDEDLTQKIMQLNQVL